MKNDKLFLNRYYSISEERFHQTFEPDFFNLSFSNVYRFNDLSEGISSLSKREREAFNKNMNVVHRALILNGGFLINSKEAIRELYKSTFNLSEIEINNIETHHENLGNNYVSCWFLSSEELNESRYMWNIYGKTICNSNNESSKIRFKITCNLEDLRDALDKKDKSLIFGKVRYSNKYFNSKNSLFIKDESFRHEKEYRILKKKKEFEEDFIFYQVPIKTISNITFANQKDYRLVSNNEHLKNVTKYTMIKDGQIKSHLNLK